MPLALITGAGSLIGEGIAQSLAAAGWRLVLSDINDQTMGSVASGLPAKSVASTEIMDVTDPDAIDRVLKKIGPLDALVNVAGGGRGLGVQLKNYVDVTRAERDKVIEVNLKGVMNCCQAVLPGMIAAKKGAIVSVSAARGLRGGPKAAVYSACKAAIIVFSQSLALEVGQHSIRVNTVAPGNTPARWKAPAPDRIRSPLGTETSPADVGAAVAFLLSDQASHITGSCLDVSGGTALH